MKGLRLSIRTRLLAMAILPVVVMFLTLVWYSYQSRQAEVRAELAERGQLLATALATSSEYGLIYGRLDDLGATIHGLVQTDSGIYRVTVLDAARKELLNVAARGVAQPEERYYEAPVHKRLVYINSGGGKTVGIMGYVQVMMSPTAMLRRQTERFYIELLVASFGLLTCGVLAYHMIDGFDTSLQQSMQALREADAEKRRLLRRVNTAVEDERQSIALEIHDELNATLIGVRLEAQQIANMVAQAQPPELAENIRVKAQSITKLALGLYNSGRSLVRRLRPEMLEMLGLQGAIEEMVRQYDSTHPDCRFSLHAEGDFSNLENGVAISAYRIVQEALSNIVKHARATSAEVSLLREQDALSVTITDNGAGFDPGRVSAGLGIIGMKERVQGQGGTYAMDCSSGTRITIKLPLGSAP